MAEKPSRLQRVVDHLKDRLSLKTLVGEAAATVTDKVIPQGAAELAQALFGESGSYVPYGPSQGPAPLEPEQQQAAPVTDRRIHQAFDNPMERRTEAAPEVQGHGLPPEANAKRNLFERPEVPPPPRGRERGDG